MPSVSSPDNALPSHARPLLKIFLATPRGFCAGVERAITIVEDLIRRHGAPVYVRHEIVHNRSVVEELRNKGAVFVEELEEIPRVDRPVVFSAHGVSRAVVDEAKRRGFTVVDATCPLVTKVHIEAQRHGQAGTHVVFVGHKGHPEVAGTMGQLPHGQATLVETIDDARTFQPPKGTRALACLTQTTLSVRDTTEILAVLRERFPHIQTPAKKDICYATENRQNAVMAIATKVDAMVVLGSRNSSNSRRLVEVAESQGCSRAWLVDTPEDIPWEALAHVRRLGLSAGASAPERLVQDTVQALRRRFTVRLETVGNVVENVRFHARVKPRQGALPGTSPGETFGRSGIERGESAEGVGGSEAR